MKMRNRIVELRRVPAGDLVANRKNWRTHPPQQRQAVSELLAEVGCADALLAREDGDGRLVLIDGHLRADLLADQVVPVLVLDVNEAEADKLLLTLDPLAKMADVDRAALDVLLTQDEEKSGALADLQKQMADQAGLYREGDDAAQSASFEVDDAEFSFSHRCTECGFEFSPR
jgi:ParB-like chromosome segregation protein Spo0J